MEENKREEQDTREFAIYGVASIIYAVVFVFCLYKNFSGITSPIWAGATVYYMYYIYKKVSAKWNTINTFCGTVIVLLGISNFITGNVDIICLNYLAIFAIIIVNVMYIFVNTKGVNVTRHFCAIVQLLFGTLGEIPAPVRQLKCGVKQYKSKKNEKVIYAIIGIAIAVPLMGIMIALLASADQVFKEVFRDIGELLNLDNIVPNVIGIAVMAVVGYIAPYAVFVYGNKKEVSPKTDKSGRNEPIIAIIVSGAISIIYILFSVIQVVYLFAGAGTLPEGYTYAEYAREGFFQLLFVSAFNLVMILVCIEFFKDSKVLDVILTIISLCTFIMIASSAYRMGMYIDEYGLTFTRVFVLWALAVITLVMAGLIFQLYKKEFNLFKYSLVVASICYLALSFSHIDYFIAKYDLDMYSRMEEHQISDESDYNYEYVDYHYILNLSSDAAPAVEEHSEEIINYIENLEWGEVYSDWAYVYDKDYKQEKSRFSIRKFNISEYIADNIQP